VEDGSHVSKNKNSSRTIVKTQLTRTKKLIGLTWRAHHEDQS